MKTTRLVLEILNGPLDGHKVHLEKDTIWSKEGTGHLIFPWDTELGNPQTRFFCEETEWWLKGFEAPHGTYCLNRDGRIEGKRKMRKGDLLKASETLLLVLEIE